MTKQNIIDIVSDATGLTKVETEAVMNGVMKTIIDSLASINRVELRGVGTFSVNIVCLKKLGIQERVMQYTYLKGLSLLSNRVR